MIKILFAFWFFVSSVHCSDYGDALFLTKFIKNGDIQGGREASKVRPFLNDVESYAGFFTVNEKYNSNLFFWFFPAERYSKHAPVVVWLQGGPGASSLYGLYVENGVYYLDRDLNLSIREYHWSKTANVIYIDNPVGTGFSFTENEKGYATNMDAVGNDLHEAITQFFILFPEYLKNELYIFGESYGGKYAPAMAYKIHTNGGLNLKGIAIGNGLTDPPNMMIYDELLYQIGLIDENGKQRYQKMQKDILSAVENKNFSEAGELFWTLAGKMFLNETGFSYHYNFLHNKDDTMDGNLTEYFNNETIRKELHVGNVTYDDDSDIVIKYLASDGMVTVVPWLKVLLENYRLLFYNGQLDIICSYSATVNYLKKLDWSGSHEYAGAQRKAWYVNDKLAGYVKKAKSMTEVLIRDAGHIVPQDQPLWAYVLFNNFIFNKNF